MFRVLQMLKNPPLYVAHTQQHYEFDMFWSLYMSYIRAIHKNDIKKVKLLKNEYERTIFSLFEVYTLCNRDLHVTTDVLTYTITNDIGLIRFCPLHVVHRDIRMTQRDCCLVLADIWLQVHIVEITIDLHALTTSLLYILLKETHGDNLRNGIALWTVLPCNVKKITVIEPDRLHGWNVLKRAISMFVSTKLYSRCVFQKQLVHDTPHTRV